MTTKRLSLRSGFLAPFVILAASLLASCTFQHGFFITCNDFENIPVTPLTSQTSQLVFDAAGTIIKGGPAGGR